MRVIVTRPAAQASPWVQSLEQHGLTARALPLMEIAPALDATEVANAWLRLGEAQLVMFVSANAVEHFFALRPSGAAWPTRTQAGSPGPGTTRALLDAGVPMSQIVEPAHDSPQFDSEALWQTLREQDWQGKSVQVVRGDGGRDWLADTLRAHGADVGFVSAYRRVPPRWDAAAQSRLAEALARPADHLWLFSSSESINHLMAHLRQSALVLPSGARALATHPRIAEALRQAGFGLVQVARPALADLLASIESLA